jgi:REP element-mobilizing transposase RayT
MRQRHSYHRLFYHLVFATKRREHLIASPEDGGRLLQLFKVKAAKLDAYVEEFGCYRDHVHLLARSAPALALSDLYGQLKGFAAYALRARFPERPFGWQDGVWVATVDPDANADLRGYIRGQWRQHEDRVLVDRWEPEPEDF